MNVQRLERFLVIALVAATSGCAARQPISVQRNTIVLGGKIIAVDWIDGDTFRVAETPFRGIKGRLADVDALELDRHYRWGSATDDSIGSIATDAKEVAASQQWQCTSSERVDKRGRLLVSCPHLADALVGRGLALAAAYRRGDNEARRYIPTQQRAKSSRVGMWAVGEPSRIPVRVRSERKGDGTGEVRAIDTNTGKVTSARVNSDSGWFCIGQGADEACVTTKVRSTRRGASKAADPRSRSRTTAT
jgi:endonuclease YncB( thermonuclease family)